jgi:hypothetical protein
MAIGWNDLVPVLMIIKKAKVDKLKPQFHF